MLKWNDASALLALSLGCPALAWGGGFEFPANGTEALGRGGAFTAKADSPLALEYNVAGLGRQRGTRLLFDSNLHLHSYSFERAPQPGGMTYPLVEDQGQQPFYGPFFGLSSDFGYFDRWTFAIGAFGPSSIGRRSYPIGDRNVGAGPARYDVVSTDLLTIFPTIAAAARPSRYFDIGIGLQLGFGTFKLSSVSRTEDNRCRYPMGHPMQGQPDLDSTACDTRTEVDVKSSVNPMLTLGILAHPSRNVDIGFHVRSAANLGAKRIEARGTLRASALDGTELGKEEATFLTDLPWIFRFGVRYAFFSGAREAGDIEFDATYEAWSLSEGEGSRLQAEFHPIAADRSLDVLLPHYYRDTYSLRLGGAFNQSVGPAELTLRLGLFYDSAATSDADTRLDFNTLPKLGATGGLGLRYRGVTLNLAYAFLHSFDRTVTDGRLRPTNGLTGLPLADMSGNLVAAVNNGIYRGRNHILSLGLLVQFDELVKGDRWTRLRRASGPPQGAVQDVRRGMDIGDGRGGQPFSQ